MRPLLPHEYRYVFQILVDGPMAAADFAGWGVWRGKSAQAISNQMCPLVRRGWLVKRGVIFDVTERARASVCW